MNPDKRIQFDLKPHQTEAGNKLMENDGSLLIAHKTGSGKTVTSLHAFDKLKKSGKAKKALIIIPPGILPQFQDTILNKTNFSSQEIKSKTKVQDGKELYLISKDTFIMNPSKYMASIKPDTLIVDELHNQRNNKTKSYQALKSVRPFVKNFIGLTASPINNHPSDIASLYELVSGKEGVINRRDLASKARGFSFFRSKNSPKLTFNIEKNQNKMNELKKYVDYKSDKDLKVSYPKIERQTINIDMSKEQKQLFNYAVKRRNAALMKKYKGIVPQKYRDSKGFATMMLARKVSNGIHVMNPNYSLSESAEKTPKIAKAIEVAKSHLESGKKNKVVIYSNNISGGIDVLEQGLRDQGISSTKFIGTGTLSKKNREKNIADFKSGSRRVLLITRAGSEGISLPNTNMMITIDPDFNPEKMKQTEARIIRQDSLLDRKPEDRKIKVVNINSIVPDRTLLGQVAKFVGLKKKERFGSNQWEKNISSRKDRVNDQFLKLMTDSPTTTNPSKKLKSSPKENSSSSS